MFFLDSINFFGGLSSAIQAALLLIVGLIAAAIARFVVKKILVRVMNRQEQRQIAQTESQNGSDPEDKTEVKKGILSGLSENKMQIASIIGNLVFAIVFLLFLPGALDKLGVDSVASPISGMARKFVEFIPRIIAAIIILVFGYFLSKLARDILKVILQKTKIDSLQSKIGVKSARNSASFSGIIANIVFALLMIIFVIAALQALQLHSISDPASEMLSRVFTYLPLLFAALIVIVIGIFIANIVSGLLENVIAGTGFDDRIGEIMPKNKEGKPAIAFSKLLGIIVRVVIIIFFVVAGLRIMNIEVLTKIGTTIIAYMPNILAAIIVFIVAWFVADKVSKLILKANPEGETFAKAVKWIIYIIAAFMILSQLHIASNIVHILFIALVVGLAGAFAIAFGVGGRFWAAKKLEDLDKNLEEQKAKREQYKAMRAAAGEGSEKAEKKRGSFFSGFGKKSEAAAADTVNAAKTNAYAASETAADEASNAVNSASGAADAAADGAQKAGSAVSETAGNGIDKAKDVSADSVKKAADAKADDPEDSPYYYKNK